MTELQRQKNREYAARWRMKNKDKVKGYTLKHKKRFLAYSKELYAKIRTELYRVYGDKCVHCGYSDKRALSLDHVHGEGHKERKNLDPRRIYQKAIREYGSGEYQILCMNCQFCKAHKEPIG